MNIEYLKILSTYNSDAEQSEGRFESNAHKKTEKWQKQKKNPSNLLF